MSVSRVENPQKWLFGWFAAGRCHLSRQSAQQIEKSPNVGSAARRCRDICAAASGTCYASDGPART